MIFRQVIHDDLGCASYLIGDERAGIAAVVDPRLDVEVYLALARAYGVRIEHVLETHTHADHVSGHGRLVAATGATVHVHASARPAFDHDAFEDGAELALGAVRLRAVHTPGHRPEHTAFAVVDGARGPEPVALLTGDSLFVGGVARPDLAVEREAGARALFRSLHDRLLRFPPGCEVWPGHVGGSLCGGPGLSLKVASTIGYERDHQELLGLGEREFVRALLASLGPPPPNLDAIVARNRGPLRAWEVDPPPLSAREVAASGALVVDVRADDEFDAGHVPGALSVSVQRSGFGSRLAAVVEPEAPIVLVGGDVRRAVALAGAVGVTTIAGHLRGGMEGWNRPVARIERIGVADLHALDGEAVVVDVRDHAEWDEGHLDGSLHLPYRDIRGLPPALDPERPVAVICATGNRAALGASLLARHGARRVLHVAGGGVEDWPGPPLIRKTAR